MVIKVTDLNNFAISSEGIGEALQRSAAALSQANNSLEQSIALVVAANDVVQNPETVGTALRTVALRIRGAKAELDEMGESTDDLADSTSKLRDQVLALSGVDIMIDDSTFKSTYDILLELAQVWDDLTDVSQASLLEMLGGKRGANVLASVIANVHDLEAAYASALDAEGSALRENEKYLESIEGKLSQLRVTWEEFWNRSVIGDMSKMLIDFARGFMEVINALGGFNTIPIAALSTLILNIGNIAKSGAFTTVATGIKSIVSALSKTGRASLLNSIKAAQTANGGKFDFVSLFLGFDKIGKLSPQVTKGINDAVSAAAKAFDDAFNSVSGGGDAAMMAGRAAAMKALDESGASLTATTKNLVVGTYEEASAHGAAAAAEVAHKAQTAALKVEQEALTKSTQSATLALAALKAVLIIGVSVAISAFMKHMQKIKQQEQEFRDATFETAKQQTAQVESIRDAVREYKEANEQYDKGALSQDKFRDAVLKVNEALGIQSALFDGLIPGSEEYNRRIDDYVNGMTKGALTSAQVALQEAVKAGNDDLWSQFWSGFSNGMWNGSWGASIDELETYYPTTFEGKIRLYAELTNDIKLAQDELEKLTVLEQKYISMHGAGLYSDREHADNMAWVKEQREFYQSVISDAGKFASEYKDVVEPYLENAFAVFSLQANPQNALDYYKALSNIGDYLGDSVDFERFPEILDLINTKLGEDARFIGFAKSVEDATNAIEVLGKDWLDVETMLASFDAGDLTKLGSEGFREFVTESNYAINSVRDLEEALKSYGEVVTQRARETNVLSGVINQNAEAIDGFQDKISKIGNIITKDYANDAAGLLDAYQDIVSLAGELGDEADYVVDGLNASGFSAEALKNAAEELAEIELDNIIEALNIDDPALENTLRNIVKEAQQLETVTRGLDGLKGVYTSLTDIIKEYNESGMFTADALGTLLSMDAEYLAMLKVQNGQLALNRDALVDLLTVRLEEAKAQIDQNTLTHIRMIYQEAEAEATKNSMDSNIGFVKSLILQVQALIGSNEAMEQNIAELEDLEAAYSGMRNASFLTDEVRDAIDARYELGEAQKRSLDEVRDSVLSGSNDILNAFLGVTESIEDAAEEASDKLKSAIDETMSYYKDALDSGAITYKDYLDKLVRLRKEYGGKLTDRDLLQLNKEIAQEELNLMNEVKGALDRYYDRMADSIQKEIDLLEKEKDALEENKKAVEDHFDSIIDGLKKQKDEIEKTIDSINKAYESQIKPLEDQRKANEKLIKAIEKEKQVYEDQIEALERSKRPYQQQIKENQKVINAIEAEIAAHEALKVPYENEQRQIEKAIKEIEKEIEAREALKKPYEDEIKLNDKAIKAIQKEIKAREALKKPFEDEQKAIEKEVKAIQKRIDALEDTKKPYEDQQKAIEKQIKQIQKEVKALENLKKPYEDQQKAIDKEIKGIEKEIRAIRKTEKPYLDEQKAIEKSIRAIEEKILAFEELQEPYKQQLTLINNEIEALEREVSLLERTKKPYEDRKQIIQNQIDEMEYQISVMERSETAYKRQQDAISREIELIDREVSALEQTKRPYEIAQREIERQINLLERQQKELEKLTEPYQKEIEALEKEKEALAEANEERNRALQLQEAEYNLRRAQQQRTNLVYQDGQFQYVADQGAIKDAQKTIDDLRYEESVKKIDDAIDSLQDKIDSILEQSDLIQDAIDDLTDKNEQLQWSIDDIQYAIDQLQDKIADLEYTNDQLQWSIDDVEYSLKGLKYAIEDLETEGDDLEESIRRIDVQIQPLKSDIEELKIAAEDLQFEIDKIQQSIEPLNDEIDALNRRNEELQQKIDEIEESIEPLNERIDELNEKSEEIQEVIDEITASIDPLNAKIDELNEQNDALQEKIDEITDSIEPLEDEIDNLNAKNDELQEKIDEITDSLAPLEDEMERLQERNEELQESIDAIDESIEPLNQQIDELNQRGDELQTMIDEIDSAIEPLQQRLDEVNRQNEELNRSIELIDESIEDLRMQIEPLDDKIKELNRSNEDLGDQIDILKEKQEAETQAFRDQIEVIDAEIEKYGELKDAAVASIDEQIVAKDKIIAAWQKEKQAVEEFAQGFQDFVDQIEARKDEDLLAQMFGQGWEEKLQKLDPEIFSAFSTGYEQAVENLKVANENIIGSYGDVEMQLERTKEDSDALKDSMANASEATGPNSINAALHTTGDQAIISGGIFIQTKDQAEELKNSLNTEKSLNIAEHRGLINLLNASSKAAEEAIETFDRTETAVNRLRQAIEYNVESILTTVYGMVEQVRASSQATVDMLDRTVREVWDRCKQITEDVRGMAQETSGILQEVLHEFKELETSIAGIAENIINLANDFGNSWDDAAGKVENIAGNLSNTINDLVNKSSNALSDISRNVQEIQNQAQQAQQYQTQAQQQSVPNQTYKSYSSQSQPRQTTNNSTQKQQKSENAGVKRIKYNEIRSMTKTVTGNLKWRKQLDEWKSQGYTVEVVDERGRLVNRYAKGGVVGRSNGGGLSIALNDLARSVGEDTMIAVKEGERVLTQQQNKDFEQLVKLTPELIRANESLARFAKMFELITSDGSVAAQDNIKRGIAKNLGDNPYGNMSNNKIELNIGEIHAHEVKDVDDFARQIKNNLPNALLQKLGKTG